MKKILGLLLIIGPSIVVAADADIDLYRQELAALDVFALESLPASPAGSRSESPGAFERECFCPHDDCAFVASTQKEVDQHVAGVHASAGTTQEKPQSRRKIKKNYSLEKRTGKPVCPFCDQTFANTSNAHRHVRSRHADTLAALAALKESNE